MQVSCTTDLKLRDALAWVICTLAFRVHSKISFSLPPNNPNCRQSPNFLVQGCRLAVQALANRSMEQSSACGLRSPRLLYKALWHKGAGRNSYGDVYRMLQSAGWKPVVETSALMSFNGLAECNFNSILGRSLFWTPQPDFTHEEFPNDGAAAGSGRLQSAQISRGKCGSLQRRMLVCAS